jgi:uncharacterized protein (TIGR03083 family)
MATRQPPVRRKEAIVTIATNDLPATPDRTELSSDIEATRAAFHTLLDSLSADEWKRKSANPAWSVGQLMWHVANGMEFFNRSIGYCRKGSGPNPPAFVIGVGNVLLTRFGSRGATPETVRAKFDEGTQELLASLQSIGDDEWPKGARIYGDDYTIASLFTQVREHFREHEMDILKGLGRI